MPPAFGALRGDNLHFQQRHIQFNNDLDAFRLCSLSTYPSRTLKNDPEKLPKQNNVDDFPQSGGYFFTAMTESTKIIVSKLRLIDWL